MRREIPDDVANLLFWEEDQVSRDIGIMPAAKAMHLKIDGRLLVVLRGTGCHALLFCSSGDFGGVLDCADGNGVGKSVTPPTPNWRSEDVQPCPRPRSLALGATIGAPAGASRGRGLSRWLASYGVDLAVSEKELVGVAAARECEAGDALGWALFAGEGFSQDAKRLHEQHQLLLEAPGREVMVRQPVHKDLHLGRPRLNRGRGGCSRRQLGTYMDVRFRQTIPGDALGAGLPVRAKGVGNQGKDKPRERKVIKGKIPSLGICSPRRQWSRPASASEHIQCEESGRNRPWNRNPEEVCSTPRPGRKMGRGRCRRQTKDKRSGGAAPRGKADRGRNWSYARKSETGTDRRTRTPRVIELREALQELWSRPIERLG